MTPNLVQRNVIPDSSSPGVEPSKHDPRREASLPRIFSGLRIVATSTLASRVLGMVREIASARLFGLSPVWDAFSFAFLIPNLTRSLFGEGALSAAFLPVFAREFENGGDGQRQSAWQLASAVFALLAAVLSGLVLAGEIVLWGLGSLFTGHSDTRLVLGLTAVMLPYALLICLAAQVTAVLHAMGHFTWPALAPVMLNVCWIATIWLVDPLFDPDRVAQIYALAVCINVAGVLQLALQWPTLRKLGFRFDRRWRKIAPAVGEIIRAVLPVAIGLSITQINTLADRLIAWSLTKPVAGAGVLKLPFGLDYPLAPGAVSALYFGERLYQFPLGVFGVALGTVLFPLLSRHAARGEYDRIRDDLSLGLRLVLVIGLPASAGLALVASPLTSVLFQHGHFTGDDAQRTASILVAYSAGIWAYCGIPVLYRGFYAVGERRIPVKVGLAAIVFDAALNLSLIWPLAELGLAASTAISASLQVALLAWLIQRCIGLLDWRRLASTAGKALGATAAMTCGCLAVVRLLPPGTGRLNELIALAVPVAAGIAVYGLAARCLGIEELWLVFRREPGPTDHSP